MSVAAITGRRVGPELYPVPLEITILRVEPKEMGLRDRFLVEIEFTNVSQQPFYFPVSRNFPEVERDGNRGRREGAVFFGTSRIRRRESISTRWGCLQARRPCRDR